MIPGPREQGGESFLQWMYDGLVRPGEGGKRGRPKADFLDLDGRLLERRATSRRCSYPSKPFSTVGSFGTSAQLGESSGLLFSLLLSLFVIWNMYRGSRYVFTLLLLGDFN